MAQWMAVTFLGTSSGGGIILLFRIDLRNAAADEISIRHVKWWIVGKELSASLLCSPAVPTSGQQLCLLLHACPHRTRQQKIDIYGPAGLRALLRTTLSLTSTRTADPYAVHELLLPTDARTPCAPADVLHSSEVPGLDFVCDADGFWRNITMGQSRRGTVHVQAGPIVHREPCIGYVFHEPAISFSPRKIAILGDTSSASAMTPLIASTPGRVSLLVHEATDAYIPPNVDAHLAAKRTVDVVKQKTEERGHSTPVEAGRCAGMWAAERLVLNHIGARFPAPSHGASISKKHHIAVLREMERQATEAWLQTPCTLPSHVSSTSATSEEDREDRCKATAAHDFMTVEIPSASRANEFRYTSDREKGAGEIRGQNQMGRGNGAVNHGGIGNAKRGRWVSEGNGLESVVGFGALVKRRRGA
ncbi:hypothetical protein EW146_g6327 [Bondarzewia mesenterica]|uniref:Metallo-beta-lactamase domain-containing protein n=1 Tax=Bondarzewia mesenterica TaxID=1095465 RepID=A0A4S4LNY4_9AGAM|nr:hypothetical protein EW146_g6327 [Bondarzewia mesenterica]